MKILFTFLMTILLALPLVANAAVSTALPDFERQAADLTNGGLDGELVASSPYMDDGFLCLLRQQDGFMYAFYNTAARKAGYVRYEQGHYTDQYKPRALVWADRNKGEYGYNPMMFWMEIPSDVQNEDAQLGTWRGDTHVVPVYAIYSGVGNGGEPTVERMFSGEEEYPSHYHSYLQTKRLNQMAGTVMRHCVLLGLDMEQRGLNPANLLVYSDCQSMDYQKLRNVQQLAPVNGDWGMPGVKPMRFTSNADEVRVSLEYGHIDMNTYQFVCDREICWVITEAGKVYEFQAFEGEGMPYYRVVAQTPEYYETWDVMPDMRDGSVVFRLDTRAPKG